MRITSNDRYLDLLLKSLSTTIEPELQSGNAKATLSMIKGVLGELLKREQVTGPLLREVIREGLDLQDSLAIALHAPAPTGTASRSAIEAVSLRDDASLSSLLLQYEVLCDNLDRLSEQLARDEVSEEAAALLKRVAEWELSYYERQAQLPVPTLSSIDNPKQPLDRQLLQDFLNSLPGSTGTAEVSRLEPLPGGFGKQTYFASYHTHPGAEPRELVVRKNDPTPIMSHGACDLESEYALLRTLAQVDYPAPKPRDFAKDFQNLDASFYTMDRIAGATPGTFLGGLSENADEELFMKLAERLGQLHALPLEMFADYIERHEDPRILGGSVEDCYRYNLEGWNRYMERERHLPSPYLSWLLHWLRHNIPRDARRPILVHGDFNIHNILFDQGRLTAVLDWECSGFGAPEQDLAYIKPHISQHVDWERFVNHYQAHGGLPVNPQAMAFGFVYSALRTNLAGNRGTSNMQSGRNQDLRYTMVELGFTRSFMAMALNSAYPNA
ncbi:MAG: phosphotransferase family protein [Pseudomonadaceae bacterium]